MKKPFPTFLQQSAEACEHIYVSAGRVGAQVELSPKDLRKVIQCAFADVIQAENE